MSRSIASRRFDAAAALAVAAAIACLLGPSAGLKACATAVRASAPQAPPSEAAARTLFDAHCATCHSADGRGAERGPDIVSSSSAALRSANDIARVVRDGIPAAGMPASRLPAAEIETLARFVRGLTDAAHIADPDRTTMPPMVPRTATRAWADGDWPTYNGTDDGNRHSRLSHLTPANVAQLRVKWLAPVGAARNLRTTPVVAGGVMYVTAPNEVHALDAGSGATIWRYTRPRTPGVIGDAGAGVNRGVALRGDYLYFVTDDARLVALHRANGQLRWETVMADFRAHYGATGAPLVVGDLVVSGVSGGDEGIRGFVAAFDADTGKEAWRFWTAPLPGEPGSETWRGKAIAYPCAATWLTGSYDAGTDLLLWTTGNPCPDYNGDERLGDNLWSNSVVALEPRTGRLRWYYQFTPHDLHDWDAVQTVIATDTLFHGRPRELLLQANRNGFFYVLDRPTGQLLLAKPFITNMSWATGVGADGRPRRIPGAEPTIRGTRVCPSVVGATNWMAPAFNPDARLFYVMALEECGVYRKSEAWFTPGESFYGGTTENVPGEPGRKYLRAIAIDDGSIAWEVAQQGPATSWGGVLSTATGLVFYGDDSGDFAAVDARSGRSLWRFPANAAWRASPMTYTVGGEQFIAVAAGGHILAFGL